MTMSVAVLRVLAERVDIQPTAVATTALANTALLLQPEPSRFKMQSGSYINAVG
ncbi:hypothetical protein [Alicyclobacillus sacchari]|uniref:hypothetical protein n=1 Tax=Alicyclobacillus sacchari TaxID=392010 RepID=UPI0032AEB2A1